MHYVASRSFETAEEADEWLSFLVEEQGYTIDHPAGEVSIRIVFYEQINLLGYAVTFIHSTSLCVRVGKCVRR